MKKKLIPVGLILILLIAAVTLWRVTSSISATDLMHGISSATEDGKAADDRFIRSMADFSVELFKQSYLSTNTGADKKSALISPVSVMLALTMTANGADQNTLSQMEKVLGGDIPLSDLNRYLYSYVKSLPSENKFKLNLANSIWFKNGLQVHKDFLQTNANYFGANAYMGDFGNKTLSDINKWVNTNTDGMIDQILDKIDDAAILYLINAVAFDAEWHRKYETKDVRKGDFTNISGNKQRADFMYMDENIYLEDGKATGFVKPYIGNEYSFVALLPNENVPVEEYIASLSGAEFIRTLKEAQRTEVETSLPKFTYEYELDMKNTLEVLGMPDAFDINNADFSKMAVSKENIFIAKVHHKTFIAVDERGTKAAAVTKVEMGVGSAPPQEKKKVFLNRPFVYAIIDNGTNLPVFIGVVTNV
jgi:serpin B